MKKNYKQRIDSIKKSNPFTSQTDIAYQIIIEDILNNTLVQGEKINQESLSQMLSMSRTPIRDAILKLETEGLIEKIDKGYQIYKTSIRDYVDFYEYRIRLESFAVTLASRLISEEELDVLKDMLTGYIKAIDEKDYKAISEWDMKFHKTIVLASKNPYLIHAYDHLKVKNQIFVNRLYKKDGFTHASKKKHIDIYKAIRDRDEKLAEETMVSHLKFYLYRLNNFE